MATRNPYLLLMEDLSDAERLTPGQARYFVDLYYQVQEYRKAANNQARSAEDAGEPLQMVNWAAKSFRQFEDAVKSMMDVYSSAHVAGRWAKMQYGIGPVIAAGCLAHIDIKKAPTAGHVWSFAGANPKVRWLGKAGARETVSHVLKDDKRPTFEHILVLQEKTNRKLIENDTKQPKSLYLTKDGKLTKESLIAGLARRPWSNSFKTLRWKIGECFTKFCNHNDCFYGKIYIERKFYETQMNEEGKYAEQAKLALKEKRYGKETEAFKCYSAGKLPPAHIHARAQRYAACRFLAHFWEVLYEDTYKKPAPEPYAIAHLESHTHYIPPPMWDGDNFELME